MEWRQQHAAVQRVEVQEALQLEVSRGGRFPAIMRRLLAERILSATTQTLHVPGQTVPFDFGGDAIVEARGKWNHLREIFRGENVLERGAHRSEGERVASQRSTDSCDVAVFQMDARGNAMRDLFGAAVRCAGDATANGFPKYEHVRVELPFRRAAPRPRADGVRFVRDDNGAVAAGEFARVLPVVLVRKNDANVGHGGLSKNASHVVMLEGVLERIEIIEFDDARSLGRIHRRTNVAAPRANDAVVERSE